jgi:hypothetical protein
MLDVKGGSKEFAEKVFRPKHLGDYGTAAILQIVNKSDDPKDKHMDFALNYRHKKSRNDEGVGSNKMTLETIKDEGETEEVKEQPAHAHNRKTKKLDQLGDITKTRKSTKHKVGDKD